MAKVWTSRALADLGMLLARTDPECQHQGISYFAFECTNRDGSAPLKEMTGQPFSNEVFSDRQGGRLRPDRWRHHGMGAATRTLTNERAGLGSAAATPPVVAWPNRPGRGALGQTVVTSLLPRTAGAAHGWEVWALGATRRGAGMLIAREGEGVNTDAVGDRTGPPLTLGELGKFNGLRVKASGSRAGDIPGMRTWPSSDDQIVRLSRDSG